MKRPPIAWILLGLLLGIAVTYALVIREPSQALTLEALDEARARWEEGAPADYLLVVRTSGSVEAEHRVEVREGVVYGMTTDGREASPGAWDYWSVDGLFGFLATELRNAEDCTRAYGVPPGSVVLRARFDDQLGYPEFFMRHVMGKGMAVEWRVEELRNSEGGGAGA